MAKAPEQKTRPLATIAWLRRLSGGAGALLVRTGVRGDIVAFGQHVRRVDVGVGVGVLV